MKIILLQSPTVADQIKVAMTAEKISKIAMAASMKTSRRQLDRLLGATFDAAPGCERGGTDIAGGIGVRLN